MVNIARHATVTKRSIFRPWSERKSFIMNVWFSFWVNFIQFSMEKSFKSQLDHMVQPDLSHCPSVSWVRLSKIYLARLKTGGSRSRLHFFLLDHAIPARNCPNPTKWPARFGPGRGGERALTLKAGELWLRDWKIKLNKYERLSRHCSRDVTRRRGFLGRV